MFFDSPKILPHKGIGGTHLCAPVKARKVFTKNVQENSSFLAFSTLPKP